MPYPSYSRSDLDPIHEDSQYSAPEVDLYDGRVRLRDGTLAYVATREPHARGGYLCERLVVRDIGSNVLRTFFARERGLRGILAGLCQAPYHAERAACEGVIGTIDPYTESLLRPTLTCSDAV